MAILKNLNLKGQNLVTQWGELTFNENGETEIGEDAGKKLSTLNGFSFISDEEMEKYSDDEKNSQETENTTTDESIEETEDEEIETEDSSEEENVAEYSEEELNAKNVAQLKKIAKEMGLTVASDAKKKQIIDIIIENQQ
jgi:hypothetical protein